MGKQHFVPQFYFRRFSFDGKSIAILIKKTGNVVECGPIRKQCAKDYLYGNAQNESLLAKFEIDAAKTIQQLCDIVNEEKLYELLLDEIFFQKVISVIALQKTRTIKESQSMRDIKIWGVKAAYSLLRNNNKLPLIKNGSPPPEEIDVKLDEATVMIEVLRNALPIHSILLRDLDVYLIQNKTRLHFAFSDSPVVFYNMLNHDNIGAANTGLLIFLPIDPHVAIMLADDKVYKITPAKKHIIAASYADVIRLNKLQIANAYECIYTAPDYLMALEKSWKEMDNAPMIQCPVLHSVPLGNGKIMEVEHKGPPYRLKLSFLHLRTNPPNNSIRSSADIATHKEVIKMISPSPKASPSNMK